VNGDPWKIYHNTILFAGDDIFVNHGAGPFSKELSTRVGNQVYDGNLYWRINAEPIVPFKAIETSQGFVRPESYTGYLSSMAFEESTQHYTSGWEANAVLADPQFQFNYRPLKTSPAATGAIPLGDESPIATRPYRGAVKP